MVNSMETEFAEVTSPRRHEGGSWSLSSLLGLDRCCAPAGAAVFSQQLHGAPSSRTAPARADGASEGILSSIFSKLGFLSADERRKQEEDKRIGMLKDGGIFTRRMSGKPPTPVWLQLTVESDETAARIEWRSPQLVLNRAVNKDGLALDSCRQVRVSDDSDAEYFSNAPPGDKETGLCFTLLTDKTRVVFEAASTVFCLLHSFTLLQGSQSKLNFGMARGQTGIGSLHESQAYLHSNMLTMPPQESLAHLTSFVICGFGRRNEMCGSTG